MLDPIVSEVEQYDDLVLSTPGVRLYFPLDESSGTKIADRAMNNHGTMLGTPLYDRPGPGEARSVYFNGTTTTVSWPGTNIADFGDGPYTVECWFQVTGGTGTNRKLVRTDGSTGGMELSPRSDDKIHAGKPGAGYWADGTATNLANGRWHLVSAVKNADTLKKVYLDGKDDTSAVTTQATTHSVLVMYVGSNQNSGEYFTGHICRVALYKAALTLTDHRVRWYTGQGG